MQYAITIIHAASALLLSVALARAAPPDAAAPPPPDTTAACLVCHGISEFGVVREDGRWVSLSVDGEQFAASAHGTRDCASCHRDMAEGMHRRASTDDAGIQAAMQTLERVATNDPVALAACVRCHDEQFNEYRDSVHGRAALEGNADVPICTDCHGEHYVRAADDLQSTVHPGAVVNTCASCHASQAIVGEYGVPTEQYYSYRESYHGIANRHGSVAVANCASCHGAHDVRSSADPLSSVHPDNLQNTCGQCHRAASPNVARGKIHVVVTREREPLLFYVRSGFKWLTIVVMAMLCGHIALDLFRRALSGRDR
ncbi:MAG: hypothetical protein PVH68_12900 [Armatimonadota bacterium]|jgi:hypothetical protein